MPSNNVKINNSKDTLLRHIGEAKIDRACSLEEKEGEVAARRSDEVPPQDSSTLKEDPNPCNSEVEKVEVSIQTCTRMEDGMIVSRHKKTLVLDPKQFSMNEHQQFEKEHGSDGRVVRVEKIGKPQLVLQGVVVGSQNEPLIEPAPPEMDVLVEKVADSVTFRIHWMGEKILEYKVTEQNLLVENMSHHTGLMIDRTWEKIGRDKISRGQIMQGLLSAVSNGMRISTQ